MSIWVWKTYVRNNTFGFLAHVFVDMEIFSECYGWFTDVVWWSYRGKDNEKINFNEKKAICKIQNFYILVAFLLITIVLLIAVSIYCNLIEYQAKQNISWHKSKTILFL